MIKEIVRKKVEENNLLSKNQIGFKKGSRTSDHLLTLKAIVKQYVTIGQKIVCVLCRF